MPSNIRSSKGIKINGSNFAWGGYAFNASYNVSFNGPSRCSISFLSESGEYDEAGLKARIGNSGAKKYDNIILGEWGTLRMHPLAFTVQEQPSGNILQITYYDRSINYLDKYFVLLDKRNVPTKGMNKPLRISLDGDKHIMIAGQEYIKSPTAKTLKRQTVQEQARTIRGEVLYTAGELADVIKAKGRMGGKIPVKELNLLKEFGILERDVKDPKTGKPAGTKRAGNKGQGYLYGFNGSMRNVLNSWGQKLGFTYYWHPIKDKLYFMDLRAGFPYSDMEFTINAILTRGKNIVGRNYTYSIEDTFSQGASAYFGRDGEEDGTSVPDKKYLLDVLLYPSLKCITKPARYVDGAPGPVPNKVWYDYKYIPQSEGRGTAAKLRREWDEFYPNRNDNLEFLDYLRLVKAAALGPDFFATYVLMKKIADKPYQEGSGPNQEPVQGTQYPGTLGVGIDRDEQKNTVSRTHDGEEIEDALSQWTVHPNRVVGQMYLSSGPNGAGDKQLLNVQDDTGDWVYGRDCLTARLMNPALQISSQIKSDYNTEATLKGILKDVFYGDSSRPNYWAFGPLAGEDFDFGTGPMKDIHEYPVINRIFLAKVSDNGLTEMLQDSSNNHQFMVLSAIAKAAGRFYVGKDLITPKEFKRRNYVEDSPSIYYKNTDVKDTPLSEFYEGVDLVHGAAAKAMPNSLIKEVRMHDNSGDSCNVSARRKIYKVNKNKESNERNFRIVEKPGDKPDACTVFNGKVFKDPANTARPTAEQFICSIFTKFREMNVAREAAEFGTTVVASRRPEPNEYQLGETLIFPTAAGKGYASPVTAAETLKFKGIAIVNNKQVEVDPVQAPEVTVNLAATGISSLDVASRGIWRSNQPISFIKIIAEQPGGGDLITNIFGNQPDEVAKNDSIRKINIDERNSVRIEQCCVIDQDPSLMLYDEGEQLVIPDLIKPHIERIGKFGNNPISFKSNNIQTYLKDAHAILLPYLYNVEELKEKYGGAIEGTEAAFDELDWIVDQVQLGGTYSDNANGAEAFPVFTVEAEKETGLCGPKDLVYLMKGDKFEYTHIIRPETNPRTGKPAWGTYNVREDQFGSPKGQFLTPSLEDLGIEPETCCPGDDEAKKECKDDREKRIIAALKDLCRENAFNQDTPRNGLTVTVAGSAVTDARGNPVPVSRANGAKLGYPSIPDGLEKLDVAIAGDGESTTFTVSAKRKVRIFKSEQNVDKFIKLLGPRQENKLLEGQ